MQHRSSQVDLTAHCNLELAQPDAPARARFWMLIPPCFVSEILRTSTQPEGLSPRDLWANVIAPMLQEEDPTQATIEPLASGVAWHSLGELVAPTHWLQLPRPHSILAGV
jgi:hypothetical protein